MSLESTLAGQTVLNRMVEARQAGYEVELRYIALQTASMHVDRVQKRVQEGGHGIPPEIIVRRYERSLDNLAEALRLADSAIVIDNSDTAKRTLLRKVDRQAVLDHPDPPAWLRDRLPQIEKALGQPIRIAEGLQTDTSEPH